MGTELWVADSPFTFSLTDSDKKGLEVRGFASVEIPDRDNEIVPPEEFILDRYRLAPILQVDHKYWKDENGNDISVGRAKYLYVARIESSDDPETWNVIDEDDGEFIDTYPKALIPELKSGDRGLFIIAEVTEPAVIERVESGELSTFSWRGLSRAEERLNPLTKKLEIVLKDIDLYEISLVHIPANPMATFIARKSLSAVKLDKSRFETTSQAVTYLTEHGLSSDNIEESDNFFVALQRPEAPLPLRELDVCKAATPGVSMVVGPKTPITQVLPLSEDQVLLDVLCKFNTMEVNMKTDKDTEVSEDTAKSQEPVENTEVTETTEEVTETDAVSKQLELLGSAISEKTSTGVVSALAPMLETLTSSLKDIGEGLNAFAAKAAEEPEEKEEEKEPKVEEPKEEKEAVEAVKSSDVQDAIKESEEKTANLLNEALKGFAETLGQVQKSVEKIGDTTPDAIEREESIKGAEEKKDLWAGAIPMG